MCLRHEVHIGKADVMNEKLSPDCEYRPDEQTCVREKCPISCMRNYQDQADSDIPLVTQAKPPEPQKVSWWRAHFGGRKRR